MKENTTDLATRGMRMNELIAFSLWWEALFIVQEISASHSVDLSIHRQLLFEYRGADM